METFNDNLTRWQPFFATVAAVAATLAGLLFVALSINREKITGDESRTLMRMAQRSFSDYLFAVFIALMFLMPNHFSYGLAGPLLIVTAFRTWFLVRSIVRSISGKLQSPAGMSLIREYANQVISCVGLVLVGEEIWRGEMVAIFLLVPVLSLLLYDASANAWRLLIMENGG